MLRTDDNLPRANHLAKCEKVAEFKKNYRSLKFPAHQHNQ